MPHPGGRPRTIDGKRINVYLPNKVIDYLGSNRSEKIRKLVEDEMNATLLDIARAVAEKLGVEFGEVFNWICNGDNPNLLTMADVPDLVHEWKEYNGQE